MVYFDSAYIAKFYLLEPESDDGLTTWNFLDTGLAVGRTHPVRRLLAPVRIPASTPAR